MAPQKANRAELDSSAARTAPYSNIRQADYVGPQVCAQCHEENYAHWQEHPHSRMNALASAESVLGDFSGASIFYNGKRAVFRRENGAYIAEYFKGEERLRKFRITRVVGWRYEQDYIAVQVEGPEPAGDLLYEREIRLRFSYSLRDKRWLPQSYLEPSEYPGSEYLADGTLRYDPFMPDRLPFNERCARCHNTYPYDLRLYKILTPDGMLSGFPPNRSIAPALLAELARREGDSDLLRRQTFPVDRFVSVGISCESCHLGGREHAENDREIRFVPTHPLLKGWLPEYKGGRKNPKLVNALCRQCHHSGASSKDNWPDGSAGVNSMEAVEMDRGGCASQLRCTHCHDTHISGPPAGGPDRKEHLQACLDCHQDLQETAEAHSRHTPEQASCLDCHMPRIVQGFYVNNRSHRISSPSQREILATGMPNACNLCHLDRSLAWTRDELAKGWGKQVRLSPLLKERFGDNYEKEAGITWLSHPSSLLQTVAAGAYARSPLGKEALPVLIDHLDDANTYGANAYGRMRFLQAIEDIIGHRLGDGEYTPMAGAALRAEQVGRLRKKYLGAN